MKKNKILIVEDESIVSMGLKQDLKKIGINVSGIASTGKQAIKQAEKTNPDLILMDIKLKGKMDGIQAAEKIVEKYDIPIIYLTAYGDNKTLQRAKITEPYGYIIKPYKERDLKVSIEMALYKKQIEEERVIRNSAIEASLNGIVLADMHGNITFANQSFLDMWGYKNEEEVLGKPIFSFWHGKGKTVDMIDELLDNGSWTGEMTAERKNDEHFDVQIGATVVEKNKKDPVCMMASFVDVTEKNKAEREVQKTKKHLQNIINSASEIVISFDTEKKISLWNKTAERVTGLKQNKTLGRPIKDFDFLEKKEDFITYVDKILNEGTSFNEEIFLNDKNGVPRIINMSFSTLKSEKNEPVGALVIGKDVTHERETHNKIKQGHSYFIYEKDISKSLNLLTNLEKNGYNLYVISRKNPDLIKSMLPPLDIKTGLLGSKTSKKNVFSNLDDLKYSVKDFCKKNKKSLVFLDGLHFFMVKYAFYDVISSFFEIVDEIEENNAVFLLNLDPDLLDTKQKAIVENELEMLPSQKLDNIKLEDNLYNILSYIHEQNRKNSLVSLKKITRRFNIVYFTANKRLKVLESKDLIFTKMDGNYKTIHITKKGESLLNKRNTI